jgi:hypothetical protein
MQDLQLVYRALGGDFGHLHSISKGLVDQVFMLSIA